MKSTEVQSPSQEHIVIYMYCRKTWLKCPELRCIGQAYYSKIWPTWTLIPRIYMQDFYKSASLGVGVYCGTLQGWAVYFG